MGLFDDYSTPVDQIPTGFGLSISSVPYAVVLTDVKKVQKKDGTDATVLTFTVDTAEDQEHRKGKEDIFINKPVNGDKNADNNAKTAKMWVAQHLAIPQHVYSQEGFDIPDVKDKLIGNVRGYLLITQNGEYTNKRFTRAKQEQGTTGPSEVKVPEPKQEEGLDFAKLLAEQESNTGDTW